MSLFKQMKDIRSNVEELLVNYPHLRDNDYKLVATYHLFELGGREKANQITASEFLEKYANGKLTNTESIRRVRAKLQEDNPRLRGTKWSERKKSGEKFNVREL